MSVSNRGRKTQKRRNDGKEHVKGNGGELFLVDREGDGVSNSKKLKPSHAETSDHADSALREDFKYLQSSISRLDEEFVDDEKEIFVSNVLKEIIPKFVDLSCTRTGSISFDKLLPLATLNDLVPIIEAFGTNTRKMCIDSYAGHVTETLIKRAFKLLREHKAKDDDEFTDVEKWTKSFCAFVYNNFEVFLNEEYACHIVRVLLEEIIQNPDLDIMITKFLKKVAKLENFSDLLTQSQPIIFFKSFIEILKNDETKKDKLIRLLIKQIAALKAKGDGLPIFATDKNCSILVEQLIEKSSPTVFEFLLKYFKKYLVLLFKDPIANFILQKLMKSCKTSEQFEIIFDEIKDSIEEILKLRHGGILTHMALACAQHQARQEEYVDAISSALNCTDKKLLFQVIGSLKSQKVIKSDVVNMDLQGSLILQHILRFKDPKEVVASLINSETSWLVKLACDKCGSHVVDAFLKSHSVEKNSKMMFIENLEKNYVELACDKFGSRTLDNIWLMAPIKIRSAIAEEFLQQIIRVRKDFFGRKLIQNYNIDEFKTDRDAWKKLQTGQKKERREKKKFL